MADVDDYDLLPLSKALLVYLNVLEQWCNSYEEDNLEHLISFGYYSQDGSLDEYDLWYDYIDMLEEINNGSRESIVFENDFRNIFVNDAFITAQQAFDASVYFSHICFEELNIEKISTILKKFGKKKGKDKLTRLYYHSVMNIMVYGPQLYKDYSD